MNCPYCNAGNQAREYQVREMMFGTREVFRYRECLQCRSICLAVTPADMGKYYPEGYYSLETGAQEPALKQWLKRRIAMQTIGGGDAIGYLLQRVLPEPMLVRIARFARVGFGDRILDVGCGEGVYLQSLESLGFRDLTGADPYIRKSVTTGRNIRLLKRELQDVDEAFDLIMFNHAFEHIPEPGKLLRMATSKLTTNGRILIRIPVAATEGWETYGADWVQLDAPRHLHIPSVGGMKRLATEVGLDVVDLSFDSTGFMYWGSELYRRDVPLADVRKAGGPAAFFTAETLREFDRKAETCNNNARGDQVAFLLAIK